MEGYKWLIDWVARVETFITSFLLGILACVIMMEVISRYLFNHPFSWVFELSMFMITYIVFLGYPIMYKQNSLIILEFLLNRISLKARGYVSLMWEVLIGIFVVFLIVAAYELQLLQSQYTSPTLDISFRFFTIPILFSGALLLLFNVYFILTHLKKVTRTERRELV